jgi:8-oxo-dGTP pyrophosphatase MutT (NUDIX family)
MDVPARVAARTERVLADLHEEWGVAETLDAMEYGPRPWYSDAVPDSVDEQLAEFAGIASVVVFLTPDREETVLVYNRHGDWEPPGGGVEGRDSLVTTAVREAREETGYEITVTDLLYTRPIEFRYDDGRSMELPLATFVGHRTGGDVRVERAEIDHPGAARGVGVFSREYLPENCRDRDRILDLLAPKEEWADHGWE